MRGRRERVARPDEAIALLSALRPDDRAIYATALYAGLRRGELCALRWQDVDLDRNLISVERAWDPRAGLIEPKSRAGRRRVPIAAPLRSELIAHRLREAAGADGLVFTNQRGQPFASGWIAERAASAAWRKAGLEPIGLHECRHTYAAFVIAAGVNAKALATYMGHSSITITLDRYGHLMPGNEQRAAHMLSSYLEHNRRATHQRSTIR